MYFQNTEPSRARQSEPSPRAAQEQPRQPLPEPSRQPPAHSLRHPSLTAPEPAYGALRGAEINLYGCQPAYPWGQPAYPWGQPTYPWGQPAYPWGQPSYPWGAASTSTPTAAPAFGYTAFGGNASSSPAPAFGTPAFGSPSAFGGQATTPLSSGMTYTEKFIRSVWPEALLEADMPLWDGGPAEAAEFEKSWALYDAADPAIFEKLRHIQDALYNSLLPPSQWPMHAGSLMSGDFEVVRRYIFRCKPSWQVTLQALFEVMDKHSMLDRARIMNRLK